MKQLLSLSWHTARILSRSYHLTIATILALLLLSLSHIASQWVLDSSATIYEDLSILAFHLIGNVFSLLIATQVLAKPLADRSILFLLSSPMNRKQWLLARFGGALLHLIMFWFILFAFWSFFHSLHSTTLSPLNIFFTLSLEGICWAVIASITLFLSTFCRLTTTLFLGLSAWIIGLSLPIIARHDLDQVGTFWGDILIYASKIWNLQVFNRAFHDPYLNEETWFFSVIYGIGLIICFLSLSCSLFSRRDI